MILVNTCPTCSGTGWTRTPLARSTDPDTSQQAARRQDAEVRRIVIGTKRADVLEAFLGHPRTAQEAALWVHRNDADVSNIKGTRRRVSDLVRAGYLLDSGVRRENPGAGTPSIVWQITGKGVRVLNEAHEAHLAKQP